MKSEMLERVKDFVAEFWHEPKHRLSADTRVNEDLGMDGDDGAEFMQAYGQRFGVDLGSFPYDKYFAPEGSATPFSVIDGLVHRVTSGRWSALTPLTLHALAEAAERRSWVVPTRTEI